MNRCSLLHLTLAALACAGVAGACGSDGADPSGVDATPVIDPGDDGVYSPTIDPADFVDVIDNPYFPLIVGARWLYEGTDGEGGTEEVEITVLDETRSVMGVSARVVRDRVTVDGELVEDTFDWFAQDREGNVWYFGEDSKDYEDGQVVSTAGSWQAGVDGAQPGIVMPANPAEGDVHRQEFYPGEAEDMFEVRELTASVDTPFGGYTDALRTGDWSPLEPDVVEEKYYVAGIGKVAEIEVAGGSGRVLLVEYEPGS